MDLAAEIVFVKTPQGSDEIATRRHGLAMRMRRLLILVDGRRTAADLSRLVPEPDLPAQLERLEADGFVARAGAAPGVAAPDATAPDPASAAPAVAAPGVAAPAGAGVPSAIPTAAAFAAPPPVCAPPPFAASPARSGTGEPLPGTVPLVPARVAAPPAEPPAARAAEAAAPGAAAPRELEALRRAIVRQLVEAIGPHADALGVRIERARTLEELRKLVPSAAQLVEAVRGRAAAAAFVQRIGPF
ncbi:MAG TPA: hypothetical protein VEA81_17330 [Burkholderiaceae bacterium]|nr:hypothetical protein [Burkholderiaceae bacterium]